MIEVKDLHKTLGGFEALRGMDMTVPGGSVYGLVGPNGAGKTTLMRHLTGVYRPDRGTISLDGREIYENPEVKARIASIPDEIFWFAGSNVRDMKNFMKGLYPSFSEDRFRRLGEAFSISEKQAIRSMSKGMKKQAAFWLAVSAMPDYIFLDEPVDGLDPVMRRQVWSAIAQDVADRGTTVVVSSHNLRELEDVCDRVGIVSEGRMLVEKSLSDLQEGTVKIQLVFSSPDQDLPEDLHVLHRSCVGRVNTVIFRGRADEITARLRTLSPLLMDVIPLTLEEIFIYEVGGAGYEMRNIVL